MRALIFVLLLCAAAVGPASAQGGSRLKLEGDIAQSSLDELKSGIRERGYPAIVQLESPGGDINAAISIGRYIRTSKLSTTTVRQCDGACFLVWAAGVRRTGGGTMDIRLDSNDSRLSAYLAEMEIPADIVAVALGDSDSRFATPALRDQAGEYAASHQRWLAAQCGELTEAEQNDWQAIQALKAVEASLGSMGMGGGGAMFNTDPETQRQAARARELTSEYREKLAGKIGELNSCRQAAVNAARAQPQ